MREHHSRSTTVSQDLARLLRQEGYQSQRRSDRDVSGRAIVEVDLADWTPRAIDLLADVLSTPEQWWEYHRTDVEAAVKGVVERMRKNG